MPGSLQTDKMAAYNRERNSVNIIVRGRELNLKEPKGRVSLAYRDLTELPREIFLRPLAVKILDIGHNNITDFRFLQALSELNTLILDSNKLTSHAIFPPLHKLEVLWVNDNCISNLALFISNISTTFPNLKHLAMMKNEAAPSYFNGGSRQEYQDYRHFVISQLTKLCTLDDSPVVPQERADAVRIYGPQRRSTSTAKQTSSGKQTKKQLETTPLLESSL